MQYKIPRNNWKDSDVEAHWDSVASVYVEENDRVKDTHDQRFGESIQYLQLENGQSVLNISSRDGEATDHILRTCSTCQVLNAEISSNLMMVASELRPEINQKKIKSYSSLPFGHGEFDRILTLETLEHVEEPIAFLRELHRVSTDDAVMVLSCPPATSEIPYQVYTLIFGGHGEGPHRFPPSSRVKKMLEVTGWKLIEHRGTVLFPVGPGWFRQWGERIIDRLQNTFISELGIRQFYVCNKK
ncbi:MAG: methyltransferase domain-containing protein [Bacteroidota bacterium]